MDKQTFVKALKLIMLLLFLPGAARGDVADSSASGFTVKNTVTIAAAPAEVYRNLIKIGRWWNPAHTFSGDSRNLSIEDEAGGCFCEELQGGGSFQHLGVVMADPGKTLRLVGALGPLQSMAVTGSMTWSLSRAENATKLELSYAVGGYHPGGLEGLAPLVDRVLLEQLIRLKRYIEKGTPEESSKAGR